MSCTETYQIASVTVLMMAAVTGGMVCNSANAAVPSQGAFHRMHTVLVIAEENTNIAVAQSTNVRISLDLRSSCSKVSGTESDSNPNYFGVLYSEQ